jgi:CubicO group peptidase (beta-lactamase class C family)
LFVVPKTAGGHPRLVLGGLAALVVGGSALAAVVTARPDAVGSNAAQAAAPRPPVRVVEDLPLLAERLRDSRFMGGVLVAQGDRVLFRQVYGKADYQNDVPLTLETRFRLASVSKQFTAAAILKLQDEGVLDVRDPVCKWIQPCPDAWAPVRIQHLLSHTSGIPDLMARPGWGVRRVTPATLDQLTQESKLYRLQFAPGTKVRYDNAAFNLAAAIVEKASGRPYETYLREALFTPAGMSDTGLGDTSNLARGYANFPGGLAAQDNANVSIVIGAGAAWSTLDDMLAWQRALHHGRVLKPDSYAQMVADHAPAEAHERGRAKDRLWGFGLFIDTIGRRVSPSLDDRQVFHTGSWSGFRNLVTWQPESDVTVIVLSNNYHQRDQVLLIAQQAMAEVLGRPIPTGMKR